MFHVGAKVYYRRRKLSDYIDVDGKEVEIKPITSKLPYIF